jgi:drug/metabolite transporter (DMT)-like permease
LYWSRGVFHMILAVFFFSLMNVAIKLIPHIPAIEIVFFRSVVSVALSLSYLKAKGINIWGNNKKYLILRGSSGAIALILYFTLIQSIPLASAVTILFLQPILTNVIGMFIVKEKVHPMQWLFYLISFSGILIVQGFDTRIDNIYLVIGLGASIFSGFAYNFIRKLKDSEHPMVIIFYFPLITLPVTGIISTTNWVAPKGWDWMILLVVGVLTQIAQYFMTRSYQAEEINKVVGLRYLSIVFALFFGWFMFNENYSWIAYVGMGVAVFGVFLNLWFKKRTSTESQTN